MADPILHPRLPNKLLIEILRRLPVKTLIRFTVVSQSWFSIIKSPQFASLHLSSCSNPQLVLHHCNFATITTMSHPELHPVTAVERQLFPGINYKGRVAGPCDGLYVVKLPCSEDDSVFFLWNPATAEKRLLPGSPRVIGDFGIGFDCSTGDYKVVHVYWGRQPTCEVYSRATDSWKEVDVRDFFLIQWASGVDGDLDIIPGESTCNVGVCSWLAGCCGFLPQRHKYLLTFDFRKEVFVKTLIPEGYRTYFLGKSEADETKACVVCSPDGFRENLDVWVLEEYGDDASWRKRRSIELPDDYCVYDLSHLVGIWKDELFFRHGLTLVSYNADTKRIRYTGVYGGVVYWFCTSYNESLVSVEGGADADSCSLVEVEKENMDAGGGLGVCDEMKEGNMDVDA